MDNTYPPYKIPLRRYFSGPAAVGYSLLVFSLLHVTAVLCGTYSLCLMSYALKSSIVEISEVAQCHSQVHRGSQRTTRVSPRPLPARRSWVVGRGVTTYMYHESVTGLGSGRGQTQYE